MQQSSASAAPHTQITDVEVVCAQDLQLPEGKNPAKSASMEQTGAGADGRD